MGIAVSDQIAIASAGISLASLAVSAVALRRARRDRSVDLAGQALAEVSDAFIGYLSVLKYRQDQRTFRMAYFLYWEDNSLSRPMEPTALPGDQVDQATFAMERVIHGRVKEEYERALKGDADWYEAFRTLETPDGPDFFRHDITSEEYQAIQIAASEADNADEVLRYLMSVTSQAPPVLTTGRVGVPAARQVELEWKRDQAAEARAARRLRRQDKVRRWARKVGW